MAVRFLLAVLAVAPVCAADWDAQSAPQYDRLFQQTNGWIGADGDYSVELTNGLTLWLFSDTFIGEMSGGRRTNATMINNSAAWQYGNDPAKAQVVFFHGQSSDGKPVSLIKPADGRGWFWLDDGVLINGKLYLFLAQIEHTDYRSVFGFRQIATWLGEVSNPSAPPPQWLITQTKIPFTQCGPDENRFFGSALAATNGFVYVFGTRQQKGTDRTMILGRAPETDLAHFAAWQFRTRTGWSAEVKDAAGLCPGIATEYSVSWLPAQRRYVLIYTDNGLSENIQARTGVEPWGPWSAATTIYRCPEAKWDRRIFCYAAKAHPMLTSGKDELIVTYAANSFDFSQLMSDGRLYWPRFIRVKSVAIDR